ncbi:hypothetical protein EI94DRAFT_1704233 [Lactarius quietus]|nr:hypothetical protein EI94DRAFT_1704233 [Lactarius quietus]
MPSQDLQQTALGKHTYEQSQGSSNVPASTSKPSGVQAKPTKKARGIVQGPAHSRLMPLVLLSKSKIENGMFTSHSGDPAIQQHKSDNTVRGKQVALEQTLSFYPGRGDNTHTLTHIDRGNLNFYTPEVDDDGFETDDDSADDKQTVQLALKHPSKFSESVTVEYTVIDSHSRGHLGQSQVPLCYVLAETWFSVTVTRWFDEASQPNNGRAEETV